MNIYFAFWFPMKPINMSSEPKKKIQLIEDFSRNISIKFNFIPIISLQKLQAAIATKLKS